VPEYDRETREAEDTVLSVFMLYPEYIPLAMESLKTDDFGAIQKRHIFDAFAVLHATGQAIDTVGLRQVVEKISREEREYFLNLDDPISGELIKPAINKLLVTRKLREISRISEQIRLAVSQNEPTDGLIAELNKLQRDVPDTLTIHGTDRISKQGTIIIFFDKKSADLADTLLPENPALAVTPNIKKQNKIAWSVLSQRKIIIWRGDHIDAADNLYAQLIRSGSSGVRILRNPSDKKSFGIIDAHDLAGWDGKKILKYITENIYDPAAEQSDATAQAEPPPLDAEPIDEASAPFQHLGYDHNVYYFLPKGSNQVVALSAGQLTQSHMMTLARVNHWETHYMNGKGVSWTGAANHIIAQSEAKGVYDPARLRGRGAWEDDGRSVLHIGNKLIVNGSVHPPHELKSHYIYEAAAKMEHDTPCAPLSSPEAKKFVDICEMLLWERKEYGKFLAGWCVLAPICGALYWRPHGHLTGTSGVGKSWIVKNIIGKIVGPAALQVLGSTTAAFIRQRLGPDARPVIHDEFESENDSSLAAVKSEIELARACSSEGDAIIGRGSADGHARSYQTRAMFLFSSIGVNIQQFADVSRITVMSLRRGDLMSKEEKQAHFDELCAKWSEVMTPEYCCAFRARMVRLIPVIRKNAETFARAGAVEIGTQRAGDQIGALLAGVYACYSAKEITLEEAKAWVAGQDWGEYRMKDDQLDEYRCLARILQTLVKVQGDRGMNYELSVGELIDIASGSTTHAVGFQDAEASLKRSGIRIYQEHQAFAVANQHSIIEKWLDRSPWSKNWAQLLGRLPDTMKVKKATYFGAGCVSKAVMIPLSVLRGE
jgi:putative DNA primase/helicase